MLDLKLLAAAAAGGSDADVVPVDKCWLRQALDELAAGRVARAAIDGALSRLHSGAPA
jgi:hypothetical protein